jgi:hypothetical protein
MESKWELPQANVEKITIEDAKFCLDQAEKQMKEVADTYLVCVNRAITLATLACGGLVALIGYSINRWDTKCVFDNLLISSILGCAYLIFQCIILTQSIKAKDYATVGVEPKVILAESFFLDTIEDKKRIIYFYINEIESYQTRLEKNKATNKRSWRKFHLSLWLLLLTPIAIAAIYFSLNLFF